MEHLSPRKQVQRSGDVIVRPPAPWTPAVHALLRHLEAVEFTGAPRIVGTGFAGDGRETVTFIPGEVDAKRIWTEEGMYELGRLLRRLHDATASWSPPADAVWQPSVLRPTEESDAIISHGDIGPWNVVTRDGRPVALIDWELAGPVDRLREIAHTGWLNARLFDDDIAVQEGLPSAEQRAAQLRAFADGYDLSASERATLVTAMIEVAILTSAADAYEAEIAPGSTEPLGLAWGVAWRARSAAWLVRHRDLFEQVLENRFTQR